MRLRFQKMHGLGNDFIVLDAVSEPLTLQPEQIRHMADRRFGIGCDQILLAEPARSSGADFFYRIYNADGSEAEQCGNGARCLARFLADRGLAQGRDLVLETRGGMIKTELQPDGQIAVDMGVPRFEPAEIPFRTDRQRARYQALYGDERVEFAALSMGNPHAVIAVDDVEAAPVGRLGPLLQADRSFPNSVNVSFMQILDRSRIRLRVYERGAGETLACGTGACAAAVAGRLWGLLDEQVTVSLGGGSLVIQWPETGSTVIMTGPAMMVFEGRIEI